MSSAAERSAISARAHAQQFPDRKDSPATILVIHDGLGVLRGSEKVMLDLMAGLPHHRWCVLTNHAEFADAAEAQGHVASVRLETLKPVFDHGFGPSSVPLLLRQARLVERLVRETGAELIHVNNATFSNWAALAAWWCGIPILAHIHSFLSRRTRVLLGVHAVDRIVGVSRAVLEPSLGDPSLHARCVVIHNGHDWAARSRIDRSTLRADLGIPASSIVLAVVGVLLPLKRVDVAFEALRHLPAELLAGTTLLVIGDGPERAALEDHARGLPVLFLGQRDDVPSLLAEVADILLMPSEKDAFPTVLLEAAAARIPRIGADAGGTPEAIMDSVDGVLVPPGDPEALARAIAELANDAQKARRLADAAERRLAEDFSSARFLEAFEILYRDMRHNSPSRVRRIATALRSFLHTMRS
ncbi:glycosyltransferase family 4 protein [Sabulicella glaciei]|uniref:Glycosyltransferase family 4 protein n=1 Tax=Sabulicella glaciei TaxID=2984948 RepID=A0ABT3NWD1_9PROT|nr:glycosyltransferase family 4 protein [Roseococcus sp. MDT2-1-1]MCW8086464.1 glycosyltransferase family 4 protein [Roseococcus sp. MDT2-1-1]